MAIWHRCLVWVLGWATLAAAACGETIEVASATMGVTGYNAGQAIGTDQFLGWRFELTTGLLVSEVGGHMVAAPDGGVFAAIVRLDALDALPPGFPFADSEVLATAAMTPPVPSDEVFVDLQALLVPGSYVLVFGSGLYEGGMTKTGTNAAMVQAGSQDLLEGVSTDSFIAWIGAEQRWRSGIASPTHGMRFVVRGAEVASLADFELDGDVDGGDLSVWGAGFGKTPDAVLTDGDADSDGSVTGSDFLEWQRAFAEAAAPTGAAVPEPVAWVLAAVAALLVASMHALRSSQTAE